MRPVRTLDLPDRSIGVHTNDQRVAFAPGVLKVANVSRVQQIEHAVGEHDRLAIVAQVFHPRGSFGQRHHLVTHRCRVLCGSALVNFIDAEKCQA